MLDSRPKDRGFEPHRRHCVVSLSKNINPSLVLVQPRKTRPFISERLLMGRKESNQTKQTKNDMYQRETTCNLLFCNFSESIFPSIAFRRNTIRKQPLILVLNTDYRLMQVKSIAECSMGHSAILSTCIKLPFSILYYSGRLS